MDKNDIGKFVIISKNKTFFMRGNKIKIFDTMNAAEMIASMYDFDTSFILKIEKIIP